jgi:hypothetical protein
MREIELLVEAYLTAERGLIAAVDSIAGAVPLPTGARSPSVDALFDALFGERRKRAWVIFAGKRRCRRGDDT